MDVSLVATAEFPYDGRKLCKGDAFTASERDAKTLKLLQKAIDAPVRGYATKVLEPPVPDASQDAASPSEPRTKRQYRRRDLKAED